MLGEVVREAARRFGDTVAQVAASGWEVTYADLDRLSDEVAAGFRTRGLREGDVVALVLPSVPEYADVPTFPPLLVRPDPGLVLTIAVAIAALLAVALAASGYGLLRAAVPARLRETQA